MALFIGKEWLEEAVKKPHARKISSVPCIVKTSEQFLWGEYEHVKTKLSVQTKREMQREKMKHELHQIHRLYEISWKGWETFSVNHKRF